MENSILNRKSQEQQMQAAGRMPPGQSLTQKFPVLHYGPVPSFNPTNWDFCISGEIAAPLRFTFEQFMQLPRLCPVHDLFAIRRGVSLNGLFRVFRLFQRLLCLH